MMRLSITTLTFTIALSARGVCSGQDGRTYVGASAMVSTQDSHRQGSAPSLPTSGAAARPSARPSK